jgi:predicted SAM-dependent methyltransferase
MGIDTINYDGQKVPKYISDGFHSQYIFPIATKICTGLGLDIGCGREDWKLPGSFGIDPKITPDLDAYNLPSWSDNLKTWDYIFSSHCLEHLPDYMKALRYWTTAIKSGGTLFLYLPHPRCVHWRPHVKMSSSVHYHQFYPEQMEEIFFSLGYRNIFVSECDLAYSFAAMGTK